jgi:hypothetical protein
MTEAGSLRRFYGQSNIRGRVNWRLHQSKACAGGAAGGTGELKLKIDHQLLTVEH